MSDKHINTQIPESEDLKYIDLASMKITNCMGCFGCWTKTPGKCVIRDDATGVYPYIAKSDSVIYISKIKYGSYDYKEITATMPLSKNLFRMAANIYWTGYGKKFGVTKKEMQTMEIEKEESKK